MPYADVYDSHCHLEYIETLSYHQTRAIIPGVNLGDVDKLVELRKKYPIYKIGFGLHPWYINDYKETNYLSKEHQECILTKLTHDLYISVTAYVPDFIGEIGLDKYRDNLELQIEVFEAQLRVAKEFNLPVIIHCVKAYNEVLSILKQHNIKRGIIHGFNANEKIAQKFYSMGFLLGIGSQITKSSLIAKSIKNIPLKYIVLESDAPFMPAFGKNSSKKSDCFLYGQILSRILNINLIDIMKQSNANISSI